MARILECNGELFDADQVVGLSSVEEIVDGDSVELFFRILLPGAKLAVCTTLKIGRLGVVYENGDLQSSFEVNPNYEQEVAAFHQKRRDLAREIWPEQSILFSEQDDKQSGITSAAFRRLRDSWFCQMLEVHAPEREWEEEDKSEDRERQNLKNKQEFDRQTEAILSGESFPIAPRLLSHVKAKPSDPS